MDNKQILAFLLNASNTGKSASVLTSFVKGVKNNPLSLDSGVNVKLKNVLSGATTKTLGGLIEGSTLSLIGQAIKDLRNTGAITAPTIEALKALPTTAILTASDVYAFVFEGVQSDALKVLAIEGQKKAALKARQTRLDDIPSPSVTTDSEDLAAYCASVVKISQDVQEAVKSASQEWQEDVLPLFSAFDALNTKPVYNPLAVIRQAVKELDNESLQALVVELSLISELRQAA